MRKTLNLALGVLAAGVAAAPFAQARAASCEGLVGTKLGDGVVTAAEPLATGQKLSLAGPLAAFPIAPVAARACRVQALLSPAPGSEIKVEVWLPETWNGKFVGNGGGGFSGGLDTAAITLNPLAAKGYAGAVTDVGHPSSDGAKWAYGQPAKLEDYAHRGNHVTAQFSKALAAAYYAKPVQRAYFQGCSNGGRDALMEAWRYPGDYDGVVAGAPAASWTRVMTAFAWNMRALAGPPAANLSPAKLRRVSDAVMARCDALDGVKDGVLEDPHACRFDPGELQCKAGQGGDCLDPADVRAVRAIYQGPRTRDGKPISAGWPVGGEAVEWTNWITGPTPSERQFATEYFRWMVYGDETWSLDRFDPDRDFDQASRRTGAMLNSDNPDLRPFLRHGGKLILYHGWADAALPPQNTIAYYNAVRRTAPAAAGQVRLFMAPGMAHCFGGPGPNQFDMLAALDRWMETGAAPERVIASKPDNPLAALAGLPTRSLRTRPLCAWPAQARWTGAGSTDEAANFRCEAR